jgi:hypothetical protein
VDITTSDYDDKEIEENIAHNCRANDLDVLPHIRRELSDHLKQKQYACNFFPYTNMTFSWKQSLSEMQGKAVYIKPLPRTLCKRELPSRGCPFFYQYDLQLNGECTT